MFSFPLGVGLAGVEVLVGRVDGLGDAVGLCWEPLRLLSLVASGISMSVVGVLLGTMGVVAGVGRHASVCIPLLRASDRGPLGELLGTVGVGGVPGDDRWFGVGGVDGG